MWKVRVRIEWWLDDEGMSVKKVVDAGIQLNKDCTFLISSIKIFYADFDGVK